MTTPFSANTGMPSRPTAPPFVLDLIVQAHQKASSDEGELLQLEYIATMRNRA
ncbi:hypothetical protein D3C87_840200 [compost metagenome]